MFFGVVQIDRASRHEDNDGRLPYRRYLLDQLFLYLGQMQILLIAGCIAVSGISFFALQRLIQSHAYDHHITVLCRDHRFRDPVLAPRKILHTVLLQMTAL